MSEVKSPLGKMPVKGKELRSFEVNSFEDEEAQAVAAMNMPSQEHPRPPQRPPQTTTFNSEMEGIRQVEEAKERRRQSVNGKERLAPGAVDRISALLGLTQMTRTIDLGKDIIFTLRSLKNNEVREVIRATNAAANGETAFEMRRQYLARSIKEISGASFDQFVASTNFEDKLIFIDELDDSVASRLYNEFLILREDSQSKYAIKTAEEQKEIIADLKKS